MSDINIYYQDTYNTELSLNLIQTELTYLANDNVLLNKYLTSEFNIRNESQQYDFNLRDIQVRLNEKLNLVDNQYTTKPIKFSMPDNSNNNVCLIIYDSSFQLVDKTYYINKLYIRPSSLNESIYSDISNSQILANRIPYLKLDNSGGEILKASIYNNHFYLYTAGYDICGNLKINQINESLPFANDINNDINYLFPPTMLMQDISYTHLAVENTIFDSSINLYSERSIYNSYSQKISASSYGYKSAITNPLYTNADNSNNIYYVEDKNFFANNLLSTVYIPEESSFNYVYDYIQHDFNTTSWFTPLKKFDKNLGIFIGQFVFSEDAKGVMCHEFYQDISAKNWNDQDFTSSSNVPFTAFLDISGGQLYFTPDVYFNSSLDKKQFFDDFSGNEKSGIHDISSLYSSIHNYDSDSGDFSANYYNDGFEYYAKFLSLFFKTNDKYFIYNQQKNEDATSYDISSVALKNNNKYDISYSNEVTTNNLNQYTDFPFVYKDSRLSDLSLNHKKILESTYKHANQYFSSYPPDISQSIVISSIDTNTDNSYNFLILDLSYSIDWPSEPEKQELYNKNFINPIFNNTKTLIIGRDRYMNILNTLSDGDKDSIEVSNNIYHFNHYTSLENLIINNNNIKPFTLINYDRLGLPIKSNLVECKSLKKIYFPSDISFTTSDYNVLKGTTIKKIYINKIKRDISNALLYNVTEISANVYFDNYFTNTTKEQFYFTAEQDTNVLSITTFPFSSSYNNMTFVENFTDISDIEQQLYKTKPFYIIINIPDSYIFKSDNTTNIKMGTNMLIFNSNQTYDMSYNFKYYQSDIFSNLASSFKIT